jgi:nicotinamide riboside kinase
LEAQTVKIAFTGSSSTGKTTTAETIIRLPEVKAKVERIVAEDARSLLRRLNHQSMDAMSRDELRQFQQLYFEQKVQNEAEHKSFLVDRSFVDVAAYWLVRDAPGLEADDRDRLPELCRKYASKYDLHFYFPYGGIPFKADGYRSQNDDFHREVDAMIQKLCVTWRIQPVCIESSKLESRVDQVLTTLRLISNSSDSDNAF